MSKIAAEQIERMCKLYSEIGVYSKVAKMVGSSPATVKKYVLLYSENSVDNPVRKTNIIHFNEDVLPVEQMSISDFMDNIHRSQDFNYDEMERLWDEI